MEVLKNSIVGVFGTYKRFEEYVNEGYEAVKDIKVYSPDVKIVRLLPQPESKIIIPDTAKDTTPLPGFSMQTIAVLLTGEDRCKIVQVNLIGSIPLFGSEEYLLVPFCNIYAEISKPTTYFPWTPTSL